MKKYIVFMSVSILFLVYSFSMIYSETSPIVYKVYMDSSSNNTLEVKEELVDLLDALCEGVSEDSYHVLVKENLDYLSLIESSVVSFTDGVLQVKIGDAKGSYIEGKYTFIDPCVYQEVEVQSFLFSLFQ